MAELSINTQTITSTQGLMKISGEMTTENFRELEEGINAFVEAVVPFLLIDISELTAATSAGLGALVHLSVVLHDRSGKLVLAAPTEEVAVLLDLLKLDEVVPVAKTLEEGRKLLSAKT
ncbi:MAG: STAS domain-containing protein [Planctomycetes bacterium]|nr:STAS domain-containing protein [Planctomycetota bacterium]